jgi:hypothetical protein
VGKATREANKERMAEIEQHVAWTTLQDPIVRAMAAYTKGCHVYIPTPEGEWRPGFVYFKTCKAVLVPDICDEQVVVPAGYRRLVGVNDHGKLIVTVLGDPDSSGIANRYLIELTEGLEVTVPGGKIVKLMKQNNGGYAFEESDEVETPGPTPSKKAGRKAGRKVAEG